jgi:hypothetical protein
VRNITLVFGGGSTTAFPPRSLGRDSLAMTFLDANLMSSVIRPGVVARPGVMALIGDSCLAGVVPRDTAMLLVTSTNEARTRLQDLRSEVGEIVLFPNRVRRPESECLTHACRSKEKGLRTEKQQNEMQHQRFMGPGRYHWT